MNTLRAGYAEVNIDPPVGIPLRGYFVRREASGILDSLSIRMLALSAGEQRFVPAKKYDPKTGSYREDQKPDPAQCFLMASVDHVGLARRECDRFRTAIAESTGVPFDHIYIHSVHTHTAPFTEVTDENDPAADLIRSYASFLTGRFVLAAHEAVRSLAPARMGYGTVMAPPRVAYIRRYKMKDGSTMTCPPINDSMIDHPIGTLDQRVHVVRFDREGAETVVLVNYGLHADTLNLDLVSPDWPGMLSKTFETTVPGTKVMTFVGAEGDVGSTNVHPGPGDMNDTDISFDSEMKSVGMCRFVGRALAGTVLQIYDKVAYVDVEEIRAVHRSIFAPSNRPSAEELPTAHLYKALHDAGRDAEIPYKAMALTTVVAEASRMCALENGPDGFELRLMGLGIGPVAFVGLPGEAFTEIGRQIKEAPGWALICPTVNTNSKDGYFPMATDYDDGGYETRSSRFKRGIGELLITEARSMLEELKG